MKIEFVNHSSFIVQSGEVSLLCDPWIEGTAFNDGWALISPTRFGYADFERVTHIWFSHEHPDHFAPPNLRKIPESLRRRIRVLYQGTLDRKVVDHCRKLGFGDVQELALDRWLALAPDFEVLCGAYPRGDSWLAVRAGGKVLLNLNDCNIYTPEAARPVRDLVGPVDALATQFSLSAWEGNPEEVERRRAGARTTLDRCVFHAQFFGAKQVIPFASFVWFCHDENFYINAEHNRVDRAFEELRARSPCQPCVMYPGDCLTVGESYNSRLALERHIADFDALAARPRVQAKRVSEEELLDAARKFCAVLAQQAGRRRLEVGLARAQARRLLRRLSRRVSLGDLGWLARNVLTLRPRAARIYLWDRGQAYLFDLRRGLRPSSLPQDQCEICCSADSLVYAFRFLWGGLTLQVNGRFHEVYADARASIFDYFHLTDSFNRGERFAQNSAVRRLARTLRLAS
ncbi:MAG TPA: MBL fold metallo-hydrolase [Gammaproteobacteria bacterium]|nr:MBL fold metallo-hydrolase [Gammaproteobacteria bacterium]